MKQLFLGSMSSSMSLLYCGIFSQNTKVLDPLLLETLHQAITGNVMSK